MVTKDFLFFNYSWVINSTFYFESFAKKGHSIDIITEKNLHYFVPQHQYKNVVLYLHEPWSLPITDHLLNTHLKDCVLIQHDDTDHEDVQHWSTRIPDLVMQREYTNNTKNPRGSAMGAFHFPIQSWYDPSITEKPYDLCFLANMTHPRRVVFARKIMELMNCKLNHLVWKVNIEPHVNTPSQFYNKNSFAEQKEDTKTIVNKTKIGINDFGNSYESWRTWEYASAGTSILMPQMKTKCVTNDFMPFNEYVTFRDDYSDMEEKILYLLENKKYCEFGKSAKEAYDLRHNPEKCFDFYYEQVRRYARI